MILVWIRTLSEAVKQENLAKIVEFFLGFRDIFEAKSPFNFLKLFPNVSSFDIEAKLLCLRRCLTLTVEYANE